MAKKVETARIIDISSTRTNKVSGGTSTSSVSMHIPGMGVRPFYFSNVFDEESSQIEVFELGAMASISAAMNGFNSCILCYGQTGKQNIRIEIIFTPVKLIFYFISKVLEKLTHFLVLNQHHSSTKKKNCYLSIEIAFRPPQESFFVVVLNYSMHAINWVVVA
jgi:hypothetical protein